MSDSAVIPKRILMTVDTLGGVWIYAIELISALTPHGIHVLLATTGGPLSLDQRFQVEQLTNVTLEESNFKLEWMDDPWDDVSAAGEWLLELESEFQPDCIHLNSYSHAALQWHAPTVVVGHSCVLSWWRAVHDEPAPPTWNDYLESLTRGMRAAQSIVAPTFAMLSTISENYGPCEDARVIANARRQELFGPATKEPFAIAIGRLWDGAKNISLIERAADQVLWPIYVAGDPHHPNGTAAHISKLKTLGVLSQSDVADWLSRASIYVLPARYEPFGLSILEAALSGCALVLGDIPSLRENWDDTAIFIPPDDPGALAHAINNLIQSPQCRFDLANRAIERAKHFSPEIMAISYIETYRQAMAKKLAPAGA